MTMINDFIFVLKTYSKQDLLKISRLLKVPNDFNIICKVLYLTFFKYGNMDRNISPIETEKSLDEYLDENFPRTLMKDDEDPRHDGRLMISEHHLIDNTFNPCNSLTSAIISGTKSSYYGNQSTFNILNNYAISCYSNTTEFTKFKTIVDLIDSIAILRHLAAIHSESQLSDEYDFGCWRHVVQDGRSYSATTSITETGMYRAYADKLDAILPDKEHLQRFAVKTYNSYTRRRDFPLPIIIQSYHINYNRRFVSPPNDSFGIIMRDCETLFQLIKMSSVEEIRSSELFRVRLPERERIFKQLESPNSTLEEYKLVFIALICYILPQAMPFNRGSAAITEVLISILLKSQGLGLKICRFIVDKNATCTVDLEAIFNTDFTKFFMNSFKTFLCESVNDDCDTAMALNTVEITDTRLKKCRERWPIADFTD